MFFLVGLRPRILSWLCDIMRFWATPKWQSDFFWTLHHFRFPGFITCYSLVIWRTCYMNSIFLKCAFSIYNQQRVIFGYIVPLSRFCEAKIFQKVACVWCWHHCSRCNSATHPFSGCFCRCSFHQSLRMLGFWALCLKRRIHQPEIHPKYDHFRWSRYFRQNLAHWWDDSQWTVRNPSSLHLPYQNQPKSSN